MLGIRRTETPGATIMKIGFSGDVPSVVAVVRFYRYRLTGVGVAFRHILLRALQHCSRLPPEHVIIHCECNATLTLILDGLERKY